MDTKMQRLAIMFSTATLIVGALSVAWQWHPAISVLLTVVPGLVSVLALQAIGDAEQRFKQSVATQMRSYKSTIHTLGD